MSICCVKTGITQLFVKCLTLSDIFHSQPWLFPMVPLEFSWK